MVDEGGGSGGGEGKQGDVGIARAPLGEGEGGGAKGPSEQSFNFSICLFTSYRTAYIQTKDGIGVYNYNFDPIKNKLYFIIICNIYITYTTTIQQIQQ